MSEILDAVGLAIERAEMIRAFGLYDYTSYPGDAPPFVVRNERTGETVLRTTFRGAAQTLYERLERQHLAKAALEALREFKLVFRCPHDGGVVHELRGAPEDIWQAMIDQAIKEGE